MHTVTLSTSARSQLAGQISQNGTFAHHLYAENGQHCATAHIVVEQCTDAVQVTVEIGDSRNNITLARREDTGERTALFLEQLANGVPCTVPAPGEYELVSDMESMLRNAVRLRQGTYYLPTEDVEDLTLLLTPSNSDPERAVFRFEMDSFGLTLPLLLPCDRVQAYELLASCVQELIANYRNVV